MKAVLPALAGSGYDLLAIQEGGMASLEFLRVTFGDAGDEERQRVRRHLVFLEGFPGSIESIVDMSEHDAQNQQHSKH